MTSSNSLAQDIYSHTVCTATRSIPPHTNCQQSRSSEFVAGDGLSTCPRFKMASTPEVLNKQKAAHRHLAAVYDKIQVSASRSERPASATLHPRTRSFFSVHLDSSLCDCRTLRPPFLLSAHVIVVVGSSKLEHQAMRHQSTGNLF